jgi:flavin-dependent dehydrogenase
MKSAMIAAETIFEALMTQPQPPLGLYDQWLRQSWIKDRLYPVRNLPQSFEPDFGQERSLLFHRGNSLENVSDHTACKSALGMT